MFLLWFNLVQKQKVHQQSPYYWTEAKSLSQQQNTFQTQTQKALNILKEWGKKGGLEKIC